MNTKQIFIPANKTENENEFCPDYLHFSLFNPIEFQSICSICHRIKLNFILYHRIDTQRHCFRVNLHPFEMKHELSTEKKSKLKKKMLHSRFWVDMEIIFVEKRNVFFFFIYLIFAYHRFYIILFVCKLNEGMSILSVLVKYVWFIFPIRLIRFCCQGCVVLVCSKVEKYYCRHGLCG